MSFDGGINATSTGRRHNPADPRTSISIRNLGTTDLGRMDALKILHPANEYRRVVAKIPDGAFGTTAAFERRDDYQIKSPSVPAASAANPQPYTSWTLLVLHLPLLSQRDLVIRFGNQVTMNTGVLENIVCNLLTQTTDYADETIDNSFVRAVYPDFKTLPPAVHYDVPDNIRANVEYSFLYPTVMGQDLRQVSRNLPTVSARCHSYFQSIRRTACSYTTKLDSSKLYDQGRIVAGQWYPDYKEETVKAIGNNQITIETPGEDSTGAVNTEAPAVTPSIVTVGNPNVATVRNPSGTQVNGGVTTLTGTEAYNIIREEMAYNFALPPIDIPSIMQTDEYCRDDEARTGNYMVMRVCQPSIDFSTSKAAFRIAASATQANNTDDTLNYFNFLLNNDDLWLKGWTVGVEYYENLDPHSQIRIKVVEDLECIPSRGSTYSSFTTPGHPKDDQALSVIREFCRTQPHSYHSDFNDMNKMFGTLIRGLGDVLSGLGIPVLSQLANPLANELTRLLRLD